MVDNDMPGLLYSAHTKYESSGPCGFIEEDFFIFSPCSPRGGARMDPRGTYGRIYEEDH